jgi:actin-related protein
MVSDNRFNPIVFDLGSSSVRVGWAGHDQPKFVESALLGRKVSDNSVDPVPLRFYGSSRKISEPVEPARVVRHIEGPQGWEIDTELLNPIVDTLCYSQRGLQATAHERPLISTCPTTATATYKKALYEHFMESVQVPAFFLGDTSILSVYATGRVSGICVDIGASHTTVAKVDKGLVTNCNEHYIGGDYIDSFILSRLPEVGSATPDIPGMTAAYNEHTRLALVHEIKHNGCKCSHHALPPISPSSTQQRTGRNPRRSTTTTSPHGNAESCTFKLPDNTEIDISSVVEYAAEQIFTQTDVVKNIADRLTTLDSETPETPPLVLVTGGSSHFHGLHTRVSHELEKHACKSILFPFTQWTHRNYSGFVGASMLASLSTFASLWVTPNNYSENGVDRLINSQ